MSVRDVVIIIPAYNPDEKFVSFLDTLESAGYEKIIVIDDGSRPEGRMLIDSVKDRYGLDVVRHSVNLGQGRAYKSGFNELLSGKYEDVIGAIQCDCDGQHIIEDVNRCAGLLRENPDKFILGVRDFKDKAVPFRSRFGNNLTSLVFKIFCGMNIKDTQTGLKGIPFSLIPALMETPGERFEYASSVLLETKKQGVEILQFPISTIYINGNETSHFNPLLDSIRIYSLILKYLMSSLSAFVVDIVFYSIFITMLRNVSSDYYIIVSTYLAKIISCSYSYMVNRRLVFNSTAKVPVTAIKFALICVVQATCSGFLTNGLVNLFKWNEVLCKIIVDTVLFFVSFQVQNRWVFKNERKK